MNKYRVDHLTCHLRNVAGNTVNVAYLQNALFRSLKPKPKLRHEQCYQWAESHPVSAIISGAT